MLKSAVRAPAMATPTAIPSGKLWMVTARASLAVRERRLFGPSGPPARWMCGVMWSMSSRKAKPASKPTADGMTAEAPLPISMDGMISDQTDAATITPEANPRRTFCSIGGISRFMKNTKADPRTVPRKGINRAVSTGLIVNRLFGSQELRGSDACRLLEQAGEMVREFEAQQAGGFADVVAVHQQTLALLGHE